MVVWGGSIYDYWHSQQTFNDGGRYNPVSDSWVPTAAIGAPTERDGHTAIWTGTRMVVWGGEADFPVGNPEGYLATGGRYDPATDTWTTTSFYTPPTGASPSLLRGDPRTSAWYFCERRRGLLTSTEDEAQR
jgi:N-acetylneuraminic acid mutarotase